MILIGPLQLGVFYDSELSMILSMLRVPTTLVWGTGRSGHLPDNIRPGFFKGLSPLLEV